MAKSNIPSEVVQPIIKNILGELHQSLEANLLYFVFNTLANEYNENIGKKGELQKIFISNWKREINQHLILPEVKRISKTLNDPRFQFDNLITDTEGLQPEDILILWNTALKTVEQGFLEATVEADRED